VTDTNVFQLSQPGHFADPLTEVLRKGARALLAQAVEAEVATLLSRYADQTTDDSRHAARKPNSDHTWKLGGPSLVFPTVSRQLGKGVLRGAVYEE
jgi:putative transposase